MEKKAFVKKLAIDVAIVMAVAIALIGVCFGHVIEGNLFAEIAKWVVVGLGIIGIVEAFIYLAIGPLAWHWKEKKGNEKTDTVDKE